MEGETNENKKTKSISRSVSLLKLMQNWNKIRRRTCFCVWWFRLIFLFFFVRSCSIFLTCVLLYERVLWSNHHVLNSLNSSDRFKYDLSWKRVWTEILVNFFEFVRWDVSKIDYLLRLHIFWFVFHVFAGIVTLLLIYFLFLYTNRRNWH